MIELAEEVKYETPKPESVCKVILESPTPCSYPRFVFALCHAWYAVKSRPEEKSMRQIFVEGLREAREIWGEKCERK